MKIRMIRNVISVLLLFVLTTSAITGCGTTVQAEDLMKNITPRDVSEQVKLTDKGQSAVTDFAVRLFQESMKSEKNTLISPVSVLYALAMTANGAKNNTLTQMETVMGLPTSEMNTHLGAYRQELSSSAKSKLHMANSIWFKQDESFAVKKDFLQVNADYYQSQIFQSAFDNRTLQDINDWVENNTNGMIEKIIEDQIPDNAIMYLVNALAFEAEWEVIYERHSVQADIFTKEDGTEQEVELMHSTESIYLQDEYATGFMKLYAGGEYAFAAILPNEGMSMDAYINQLTGESLAQMLKHQTDTTVKAAMPKFESEYSADMAEVLKKMGMTDAFTYPKADFTGMGPLTYKDQVIAIERVLHKTYISVGEKGTRAGAATAVEMVMKSSMPGLEEVKTVRLDRPFLYMILDTKTNSPIFMGTVMELTK